MSYFDLVSKSELLKTVDVLSNHFKPERVRWLLWIAASNSAFATACYNISNHSVGAFGFEIDKLARLEIEPDEVMRMTLSQQAEVLCRYLNSGFKLAWHEPMPHNFLLDNEEIAAKFNYAG